MSVFIKICWVVYVASILSGAAEFFYPMDSLVSVALILVFGPLAGVFVAANSKRPKLLFPILILLTIATNQSYLLVANYLIGDLIHFITR